MGSGRSTDQEEQPLQIQLSHGLLARKQGDCAEHSSARVGVNQRLLLAGIMMKRPDR